MEAIGVVASTLSLVQRSAAILQFVTALRNNINDIHDRRLLDRIWLFQKIISRSADVLPQALGDESFREHHEDTIQLCLSQRIRLLPDLEVQIHKSNKRGLSSFRSDKDTTELLTSLEFWSKLLSEEINQSVRVYSD